MPSRFLYAVLSPLAAHYIYLSVEERFFIFTLFTCLLPHAWAHPGKRWSLSHRMHYVTKIRVQVAYSAVDY